MPARLSPSRHLRVGRSKSGLGLFARTPIKKGKFIIRYRGKKIRTEDTEVMDTRYLFEINNRWTIDGSTRSNLARYINHACRPNAEVYFVKHVIKIRAIKNIKPDDEITITTAATTSTLSSRRSVASANSAPGSGPSCAPSNASASVGPGARVERRSSPYPAVIRPSLARPVIAGANDDA